MAGGKLRRAGLMRFLAVTGVIGALLVGVGPALAHRSPLKEINISGYEIFLGVDCQVDSQPAKCNDTFAGWTGGKGPVPDGWVPYSRRERGVNEGSWAVSLNYTGTPGFGSSVTIIGGTWWLKFKDGHVFSGTVTGGSVQWPGENQNIGCGTNVAKVSATITVITPASASGTFTGCLHDLPAGTVIPPKVWGTVTFN